MLLTILYPGHLGTPLGLTLFKLWSAPCLLINHNFSLTHATHPVGCTVRVSSQDPKFLKLHWFFLKTKIFSEQLQLSWQSNHVRNLLQMFLACNWHSSLHARCYTIPFGVIVCYNCLLQLYCHILHWDTGEEVSHMDLPIPWEKKLKIVVP